MKGYITHLQEVTLANTDFRCVLYTAKHCQLVLMSLKPEEEIGEEVHTLDQFFRIEAGEGKAVLDGVEHVLKSDDGIIVPAGTRHNIINTSEKSDLKLYTIYSPPDHRDGTIHVTKEDAMKDRSDKFDGKTSES